MVASESLGVEQPLPKKDPRPAGKPENPKPTGDGPPRTTPIDAPPADRPSPNEPHEMDVANL